MTKIVKKNGHTLGSVNADGLLIHTEDQQMGGLAHMLHAALVPC